MSFKQLGLEPAILANVTRLGYTEPTPIQAKAIPAVLQGKDVLAAAQTGTGKTAGFTLPILHRLLQQGDQTGKGKKRKGNPVRALILTPTRELAAQVSQSVSDYGRSTGIKSVVAFGGVSINPQQQKLRGGADIVIATPGRLLDLMSQNALRLDELEILVLDEADRMLDMGFIVDVRRILKQIPKKRHTLMFSATFSEEVKALAQDLTHHPVEISVTPTNSAVDTVKQSLIVVEKTDKTAVLTRLIKERDWYQILVFVRTRHGANRLVSRLMKADIDAMAIHGDKSQSARTKALGRFKQGELRVLVATDIAARGIDINQLPLVVNFDLPQVAEDYVHRIGRTGRAGKVGEALSLVSHDEHKLLKAIERLMDQQVARVEIEGYEPLNQLSHTKQTAKSQSRKRSPAPSKGSKGARRSNEEHSRSARPGARRTSKKAFSKKGPKTKRASSSKPNRSEEVAQNKSVSQKRGKPSQMKSSEEHPTLNRKQRRAHMQSEAALSTARRAKKKPARAKTAASKPGQRSAPSKRRP